MSNATHEYSMEPFQSPLHSDQTDDGASGHFYPLQTPTVADHESMEPHQTSYHSGRPRWAYESGRTTMPLRSGPYLDESTLQSPREHRSSPDLITNIYGEDYTDILSSDTLNADDSLASMLPSGRSSKRPMGGGRNGDGFDEYDDSFQMVPASLHIRNDTQQPYVLHEEPLYAAGSTAGARAAAQAAGYSSPVLGKKTQVKGSNSRRPLSAFFSPVAARTEENFQPPEHYHQNLSNAPQKSRGFLQGRRKWIWLALLAILALAIALGAGLGAGLKKHVDPHNLTGPKNGNGAPGPVNTKPNPNLTALPPWNWTDTKSKAYGVNIGGQFMLERWMYEDWMASAGGENVLDEWGMSVSLGDKMAGVMAQHMATWATEGDLNQMVNMGVNMIRIPIGYWPFLSTSLTKEPYVNGSQLEYFSQMLNWAHARNLYVIFDLHGMPGSQNGDQSSGHNMSYAGGFVPWYEHQNQAFSKTVVDNALEWISKHPARSVISGFTPVNEPQTNGGNATRMGILKDFYKYSIKQAGKYNMPVILHHGFAADPYVTWRPFMSQQDPTRVVFDDHPYPAWFQTPNPTNHQAILQLACSVARSAVGFPVPVLYGEYSAVTAVADPAFVTEYTNTQITAFGRSAGSVFFNFRTNATKTPYVGEQAPIIRKYSFMDMIQPKNPTGQFPVRDASMPVKQYTDSLSTACGRDPNITWTK